MDDEGISWQNIVISIVSNEECTTVIIVVASCDCVSVVQGGIRSKPVNLMFWVEIWRK